MRPDVRDLTLGCLCSLALAAAHCGSDDQDDREAADAGSDASPSEDASVDALPDPSEDAASDAAADLGREDTRAEPDADLDAESDVRSDAEPDAEPEPICDVEVVDGIAMIEAESIELTGGWSTRSAGSGYSGSGYIGWSGPRRNGDPSVDQITIAVRVAQPGRYRFDWYTRIGMGDDPTEHNDSWFAVPSAADAYGARIGSEGETRRYSKPACEDAARMAQVLTIAGVTEARCAAGSTRDGFMKVYSSGARDWRWSARTSDHDAHDIYVEFDAPGVYEIILSGRSTEQLIDRIVLHRDDIESARARDTTTQTLCARRP